MNRKEFIAVVISAALGLSGAPVYASESAAFSDGEVQEYGAEEEKQEFQTDSQDPETDTFQDEVESDADTDGFVDEATEASSGAAESDANGFTYEYLKESDTYRLTKGTDTENVIIPYEYNGKVVSEVGERAFYGCINIKTVKAEEGADRRKNRIRIDKSAFENCENLRKVSFDQGAKLESRAFYNCPKLWEYTGVSYYDSFDTEIEQDSFDADTKVIFRAGDNGIPESVKAFADKNRVFMEITDNDNYVLTDKDGTSYYDDWSEGDSRTFCVDCDDTMASVRVWSAVEVIGRKAFYGCSNVKKVLIERKTSTIESKAFAKCKNMSIIMPSGITAISDDAFDGASGITIYADKGSYAEKYAKKHNLTCKTTPAPTAVPVPKLKVSYDAKNGNATLNWTPVEYTFRYYIYRYDTATKKYKCVSKVDQNTTSYKLESPAGRTVKYKVRVRTLAGIYTDQYSKKSNTVTVQGRPGNVSDVSKKKKGKNLTFKWTKAKGAQGYILYRYDENARKYRKIKTIKNGNVTSYTDKTGKLNKNENYYVRAYCTTKDGTRLYGWYWA